MAGEAERKLGLGILSAAAIAKKNVRGISKNIKGLEVVAVASRSKAKAEAFIKETGLEGKAVAYEGYDQLLADDKVQAVYIPLPAGIRREWIEKAAKAGKHVLSEKPIALTAEDTDAIVDACKKAGVQYMDGTMWLHNPRAHYIKEVLNNEALMGKLKTAISAFNWLGDEDFLKNDVRTKKDLDGLGCLGDIGWYCVSVTLWAFNHDPPSKVQAQIGSPQNILVSHLGHPDLVLYTLDLCMPTYSDMCRYIGPSFNENGVLTHCAGTILWEDGRRAMFDCGFDRCLAQLMEVAGTKGIIQWQDFCIPMEEDSCEFTLKGHGYLSDLDTRIEQPIEQKKVYLERPQETRMWEEFTQRIYDIQDGKPPEESWARMSAMTNKVLVAVQESAENDCKAIQLKL